MFTPSSFRNITWKTYLVFGTFCGAKSIHAFFSYAETRGKTLEEVDMIFKSGTLAWRSRGFLSNTINLAISAENDISKNKISKTDDENTSEVNSLHKQL